jgi:murein DD-endopeptidase MepM/ murein hydrolase activator NlpD
MRPNNAASVIDTDGKAIVLDLSTGSRLRGEPVADLGVDRLGKLIDESMAEAGTGFATPVATPLDGTVEITADNARELDYGPLLVLRHEDPDGETFFTLYGHLGPEVLAELEVGQAVSAGQRVATVGAPPGNGNWPPHLHFQLIMDLKDLGADFPGVASVSEQDYWLRLSPSPAAFFPEYDAGKLEYS